jgi:hypothetical protein
MYRSWSERLCTSARLRSRTLACPIREIVDNSPNATVHAATVKH